MSNSEALKNIVKEKYAEIAIQKTGCGCCGDEKSEYSVFNESYENQDGYVKDADLGLGCGLPTEHAHISEGDAVLDLGSGAGNDCFVARRIVGESGSVTGLDFTEEMLEKANINNKKLGYINVNFIKGDIENIPLDDNLFDVVISNCVLNLVPDKTKAFSEIKRVLKSGGHFCVSDIVIKGNLPDKLREVATLYAGCVSGALKKEEYLDVINKAGYTNVEIKKERVINVPDELFLEHITKDELNNLKKDGYGIYSITVNGTVA
jgi:SAM-dependent methyltransferase